LGRIVWTKVGTATSFEVVGGGEGWVAVDAGGSSTVKVGTTSVGGIGLGSTGEGSAVAGIGSVSVDKTSVLLELLQDTIRSMSKHISQLDFIVIHPSIPKLSSEVQYAIPYSF
jgi:hypothetical protein